MSTTPPALINTIAPPPIQTPIVGANGLCSPQWVMWFQKVFLRAGGTTSDTVTQIVNNITNNNTSTTISDNSSQGGTGIDPDAIDDLALLSELLPVWRGEESANDIPEFPQFNTDYPQFTGVVTVDDVVSLGPLNPMPLQGAVVSWNTLTGGQGEMSLVNCRGGGPGGWYFVSEDPTTHVRTAVFHITDGGTLDIAANTATSATPGSASALPAAPLGYLNISIHGVFVKIPYYAP
jgi:hypothetical protein